jgi:hypothetical protein
VKTRPVLGATAAVSALALCVASGTAGAATAAAPAAGSASSVLSLLQVQAGGHTVRAGDLTLSSDTLTGSPVATVALTPLVVDGSAYGQQTVTPASSPVTAGAQSSPGALAGIVSLTSPAFTASATDAPSTSAGSQSLGSLSLLGMTVPLTGTVDLGSAVDAATGAVGTKTVVLENLALPSIADLLAALGLDLSALPVGTLDDLVNALDLVTGAITTAEGAVDSAQAALDAAVADLASKNADLTSAQGVLTTAQGTLTSATTALTDLLATITAPVLALYPGADTIAGYGALDALGVAAVEAVAPGTAAAYTAYTAAQAAVTAAQTAVDAAQALVDTAQALVGTLTTALAGVVATLQDALTAVLDGTPLVSLDSLSVTTKALATSAQPGGQTAQIQGGMITGLNVLGTDVLDSVLGSSSVDLLDLTSGVVSDLTATLDGLTGTLSDVLSSVPGFPVLSVPAPQVQLLTKSTSTSVVDGFGKAAADVTGLRITIPAITLPTSLALPGAASLPALTGVTQVAGQLTSAPISVGLATLSDQAAFRPAVVASTTPGGSTPGGSSGTPTLPNTGLPAGLAVVALLTLGGALVLRRRTAEQ